MNLPKPKPGYKWEPSIYQQYEEIPKDWDFVSISDTGKVIGGGTPDTTESEYWEDGNISWYTPEELTKLESNFVKDSKRKITQKGLDESSAKILQKGAILITTRATIGNCAISDNKVTTNQGFQNLEVNKNHNNKFLMYSIRYNKRRLMQYAQGTTFLEISKTNLGKIKIPCPNNVQEEEKISSILSNIDELIQKQQQVIEQTDKLKKGQMQKLFTRGIGHTKFKNIPWLYRKTIEIPEEWNSFSIKDSGIQVLDGDRGDEYPKDNDFSDRGYCLFLSAKNVTKTGFSFVECQFISKEKDQQLRKGCVSKGDIIITTRGTIGNIAYFDHTVPYEKIRINSGMAILKNETKTISQNYFYHLLKSPIIISQLNRFQFGTAQPQLTISIINQLKILIPRKIKEQQKIASILSNLDLLIQQEKQYKEKLEKIKRGLMQQLLTGKTRVKV